MTDGRGITSTYLYDDLERATRKTYPNTLPGKDENVIYTYDNCAPSASVDSAPATTKAAITIIATTPTATSAKWTLPKPQVPSIAPAYAYDDGDNLSQMTYPSGRIIDITRDGVRRHPEHQ